MKIKFSGWLFLAICICFSAARAQSVSAKPNAFAVGEVLNYEAKLSRAIVGNLPLGGANLSFTVANAPDGKDYLFLTEAISKGTLLKIFRQRFLQTYESTVDKDKFQMIKTVKHDEQGNRIRDGESFFDYPAKQVTYIETNPDDSARAPRRIASTIQDNTLDLVSGLYSLRRLPLAVGKTFELSISDSGLVYRIPVRVKARELQNTMLGKVWCFRVEPEIFGANRLIEDDGKMSLWITEDSRRIPVRAEIFAGVGKIDIKLKKMSNK